MQLRSYVYDGDAPAPHVQAVLAAISSREESVDVQDVAAADDRQAALRDAVLTVRESMRIGSNPPGIYDDQGNLDFSAGVLIIERETGRREVHVGRDALEVLEDEGER